MVLRHSVLLIELELHLGDVVEGIGEGGTLLYMRHIAIGNVATIEVCIHHSYRPD